jgi:hypothetical protein
VVAPVLLYRAEAMVLEILQGLWMVVVMFGESDCLARSYQYQESFGLCLVAIYLFYDRPLGEKLHVALSLVQSDV